MSGDRLAERLADAVDGLFVDEQATVEAARSDEHLSALLFVASEVKRLLPPETADPAFRTSLRTELLSRPRGRIVRFPGLHREGQPGRRGTGERWPVRRLVMAAAAVLVVAVAASLAYSLSRGPQPPTVARLTSTPTPPSGAAQVARVPQPTQAPATAPGTEAPQLKLAMAPTPEPSASPAPTTATPSAASKQLARVPNLLPYAVGAGVGGFGGGAVGEEKEPTRKLQFALSTPLPALPAEAPVYRYRYPAIDLEYARDLARRLGIDPDAIRFTGGDPSGAFTGSYDSFYEGPPEGQASGEIKQPPSLHVQVGDGMIQVYYPPTQQPPSPGAPDAARTIESATAWLREHGLLPTDVGTVRTEGPQDMNDPLGTRTVVFEPSWPAPLVPPSYTMRTSEGDVQVTDNRQPDIRVTVNGAGMVENATMQWPTLDSQTIYPLRTIEQAWQAVQNGGGRVTLGIGYVWQNLEARVQVNDVRMVHDYGYALDGTPYLVPEVLFSGEATIDAFTVMGESLPPRDALTGFFGPDFEVEGTTLHPHGLRVSFRATVSALDEAYQEQPHINFVLEAPVPAAPRMVAEQDIAPASTLSAEEVAALARKLGLSGKPSQEDVDGAAQWVVHGPEGDLRFLPTGLNAALRWSYDRRREGAEPEGAPIDKEAAISAATTWLSERDMLGGLAKDPATWQVPTAPQTSVIFFGTFDGLPLLDWPALTVGVDPDGTVQHVEANPQPLVAGVTRPVVSPLEAWQAVQGGGGTLRIDSDPRLKREDLASDRAVIKQFTLGYLPVVDPASGRQSFYPAYRFRGVIGLGESTRQLHFTVEFPAWKE